MALPPHLRHYASLLRLLKKLGINTSDESILWPHVQKWLDILEKHRKNYED